MKKLRVIFVMTLFLLAFGTLSAQALTIDLERWGFNIDGDIYKGGNSWGNDLHVLPSFFDDSAFDWDTGMGSITVEFDPGAPGTYSVLSFFDHDIDENENWLFNEYGEAVGTPGAGQSWEIDEPGFMFGDITDHLLLDGAYDNFNSVDSQHPEDVSMGMGWDFMLEADEISVITFLIGEEVPQGFYLAHTDPDSNKTIYFSSAIAINGTVPEPGTIALMSAGLLMFLGLRRKVLTR